MKDAKRASSLWETEYSNYFGCIGGPDTRRKTDRKNESRNEEAGATHSIQIESRSKNNIKNTPIKHFPLEANYDGFLGERREQF